MNLDEMMQAPSLVDHSWWDEGLIRPGEPTYDVGATVLPNNVKPELAVEWGFAGPDINIHEPAGIVDRNLSDDVDIQHHRVIVFARDRMNAGVMGSELTRELKANFDSETLKKSAPELIKQLRLQGLVGCIAVDARGYKNCREAFKAAELSPYKRFIKYVIGCECGDPQMIPTSRGGLIEAAETTGNAVDDFFAEGAPKPVEMVSHCRSTMLPLLAQDLDESELSDTMIDMTNTVGLPGGMAEDIKTMKGKNVDKVKAAFRWVSQRGDKEAAEPYTEKVDTSEYVVGRADNEIELAGEAVPDIDIDPSVGEVRLQAHNHKAIDVEMTQFHETEFEGTDQVDLDEPSKPLASLDVDMSQDMRI